MEMEEQYGIPDLRHVMAGKAHFAGGYHHQYGDIALGETLRYSPPPPPRDPPRLPVVYPVVLKGLDAFGFLEEGGDSQARWPRQETLTLLDIRSRLDSRFREAPSHKALLWDEVSRVMAEEHGYQRSGKKCKEKLENLYKYYKKTKEGKAGRQDGKHYRFFRQLESLYGGSSSTSTNFIQVDRTSMLTSSNPPFLSSLPDHVSEKIGERRVNFANPAGFVSSSSSEDCEEEEDEDYSLAKKKGATGSLKRGRRKSRRKSIVEFVDLQLRRFMEVQEAWLDKMLKTLEDMEEERICREESWRKQEAARNDQEQKVWAEEKAWIEARDAALLAALEKISSRRRTKCPASPLEELASAGAGAYDGEV